MNKPKFMYVTYISTTMETKGWPGVLSSLKTLLETGQPLAMTAQRWSGPPE